MLCGLSHMKTMLLFGLCINKNNRWFCCCHFYYIYILCFVTVMQVGFFFFFFLFFLHKNYHQLLRNGRRVGAGAVRGWGGRRGVEQTFNVRAKVRSVRHFFWNHQFELIFNKFFPKTNRFSSLVTKSLRKFFLEDIFQRLQVFGTNSDSK